MNAANDQPLEHCTSEQLSNLLRLAAPAQRSRSNMVELLRDHGALCDALEDRGPDGRCFGKVALEQLTSAAPDLGALVELKERAKRALQQPASVRQREALTIVYHAAVAAAYGVHGAAISSRPLESRAASYSDMAALLPPGPLHAIFVRALDRLEEQERS